MSESSTNGARRTTLFSESSSPVGAVSTAMATFCGHTNTDADVDRPSLSVAVTITW